METTNQVPPETTQSQPVTQNPVVVNTSSTFMNRLKKLDPRVRLIAISGSFLAVLLVLLVIVSLTRTPVSVSTLPSPLPSASAIASPIIGEISEFAKTAAFMQFEADLNALAKDNSTVDLAETNLAFPFLDMEVNFKQ